MTTRRNMLPLLAAAVVCAFGSAASAGKAPKVDICHSDDEGALRVISISENALRAHTAHGDLLIGVDVDENCDPLVTEADYCIRGEFPYYGDEYFDVTHDPSTGEVVGENITYGGPLVGTILPVGASALSSGASYDFVNNASYGTWFGDGTSSADDGVFAGSWWAAWGTGSATYTFTPGACF